MLPVVARPEVADDLAQLNPRSSALSVNCCRGFAQNRCATANHSLARLAERVARVSFAGFLMNQLYGAHEAELSEIAAEAAAIA